MFYRTDMKENNYLQNVQQAYTAKHLYDIILAEDMLSAAITSKEKDNSLTSHSGAENRKSVKNLYCLM